MFYFGLVVYFPYEANGHDRFIRATGPLLNLIQSDGPWVSDDEIPKSCKRALIAAEDVRFYEHMGIDPKSIELAIAKNNKRGKITWGASTITQQLVKNAFLSRTRSYLRKAREMTGAILLDIIMSKDRQLVWYFNIVEFGPRVYGLKAAADFYYRKSPKKLTSAECHELVSLLPSPKRLSQRVRVSHHTQKRYN